MMKIKILIFKYKVYQNENNRKKINKFLLLHLVFINIMINDYPKFKHKSWYQSDKRKKIWKKTGKFNNNDVSSKIFSGNFMN